jgi:transcriptional regulator with XRE-family HTH domain
MNQRRDEHLQSTIGKNARAARRELGLTQSEAAEQIDITDEFYGRIERGKALPSVVTFVRMVQALNTTADHLLFGVAPNPSKPLR